MQHVVCPDVDRLRGASEAEVKGQIREDLQQGTPQNELHLFREILKDASHWPQNYTAATVAMMHFPSPSSLVPAPHAHLFSPQAHISPLPAHPRSPAASAHAENLTLPENSPASGGFGTSGVITGRGRKAFYPHSALSCCLSQDH